MRIEVPEFSLVLLMGTSGSGKSTLARRHFLPTEVLSSDTFRGLVCDDETSQAASRHAFEMLHVMLSKRLELGRLSVVDATSVQKEARRPLLEIASRWHALKVAIVLDIPEKVCHERNAARPDRRFGPHVVRAQRNDLLKSLPGLRKEGFHKVYVLDPSQVEEVEIVRTPILSRKLEEKGPFDIIGDIHGCWDELLSLLEKLGWVKDSEGPLWSHPEGRRLIFLGDLVDRGPQPVKTVRLAMEMCRAGRAFWVPGNHDEKLKKGLLGKRVPMNHGFPETLAQFEKTTPEFRGEVAEFLDGLVSHLVFEGGALCVAHGGVPEEMQGRGSKAVRNFCLYGDATGELDDEGYPIRNDWAKEYRGRAAVIYGHTPTEDLKWVNGTLNIDTGCCFGGLLTGLRWPEKEVVQVEAKHIYAEGRIKKSSSPSQGSSAGGEDDGLLDIRDVQGRMSLETFLKGRITIREENSIAALEAMSRFAADPRWLIHLPPTMAPCDPSLREGWLERPEEAFAFYREAGEERVVCQEKHMGSRALAVVCRSEEAAAKRFQIEGEGQGIILTRTGRRFFDRPDLEKEALARLARAGEESGLFQSLNSDWMLLDMELMPWSAKAQSLIREQFAPVGAAALAASQFWQESLAGGLARGLEGLDDLAARGARMASSAQGYEDAWQRYTWKTEGLEGIKLAPFHLLASEGFVHSDKSHEWHLSQLARLCEADRGLLQPTRHKWVTLGTREEEEAAEWWEELIEKGGEGMVVKPFQFLTIRDGFPLQPATKVRGREYLRIIYGPEYLEPATLARLKKRSSRVKRSLAIKEFALGLEALERFVKKEPLRRVHPCVFGILALESEPVDSRL